MQLLPTTRIGRISTWLIAGCAAVFSIAVAIAVFADDAFDDPSFDVVRLLFGSAFLVTAAGALVTGLVATVRDRERAVAVYLAIAIGLLAVAFALADVRLG
ncbi:MAG: hypothetical protein JHD02_00915 [Thermoleophilaceae bacterium]|nr:hypothetical protein [Thermoleophilaceae bacterium]